MFEILVHLAFWTFVIQLCLFAVPVLASLYFCLYGISAAVTTLFFETYKDIEKYRAKKEAKEQALKRVRDAASAPAPEQPAELPVLKPLNCPACGAGVPLNTERVTCPFCYSSVPVPNEYRLTGRIREEATRKLRNATRYWRRTRLLTSELLRRFAQILAVWLFVSFVVILVADSYEQLGEYGKFLSANVGLLGIAVCTLFFWILILFVFSYSFSPGVRKVMPTLEFGDNLGTPENSGCAQCGAPIYYGAGDITAICGYCGVETYRAKLAWELHNIANNARQTANFSLIDAKELLSEAIWDALFGPLFLVSIFIVVPILLIGVYLGLAILMENLFLSMIAALILITAMLLLINRKRLLRMFGK
jgi:uncharacterized Zn finger protein (UPF0148 family)